MYKCDEDDALHTKIMVHKLTLYRRAEEQKKDEVLAVPENKKSKGMQSDLVMRLKNGGQQTASVTFVEKRVVLVASRRRSTSVRYDTNC